MINFYKMHGLGNDFVIVDISNYDFTLTNEQIKILCDRRFGIGCDQLILTTEIEFRKKVRLTIYNHDGSYASACGNATRCVAFHYMNKYQITLIEIITDNRLLVVTRSSNGNMIANMGSFVSMLPGLNTAGNSADLLELDFSEVVQGLPLGIFIDVGNPHVVFIVDDLATIDLQTWGRAVEYHHYLPDRANVEFVQVISQNQIKVKIWERGVGPTLACATGASASFVACLMKGLICKSEQIRVVLDGGDLFIHNYNQSIIVEGKATFVFEGKLDLSKIV